MNMAEKTKLLFGKVRFLRGKYKGQIGFYDDDEEEEGIEGCIVYLNATQPPCEGHFVIVPPSWLEQVEDESITGEDDKEPEGSS